MLGLAKTITGKFRGLLAGSFDSRRSTPYVGASRTDPTFFGWNPQAISADAATLDDREALVGRVRDIARNNGWASGLLQKKLDNVIGSGLTLQSEPDWLALGLDDAWADEWSQKVEAGYRTWANDPRNFADVRRRGTIGALQGLMYRHFVLDGECLALSLWLNRGGPFKTCIQVVDPQRLSNPNGEANSERLRAGVEMDRYGAPLAYHIRNGHPQDHIGAFGRESFKDWTWERVPAFTPHGRQQVIHYYDVAQADQTRGVSRWAPLIKLIRTSTKYDDLEVQAAIVNAAFAAVIETDMDEENILDAFSSEIQPSKVEQARAAYGKQHPLIIQDLRIPRLFAREKLNFNQSHHPNSVYTLFQTHFLRHIAACSGLAFEQVAMNWEKTNYSSARAALVEVYKFVVREQDSFGQRAATPMFALWLEEAIDRGMIPMPKGAPGFHEAFPAYVRCTWMGPPRGWVDPLKEAQAAAARQAAGISTQKAECAQQGRNYREVNAQLAREKQQREDLSLESPAMPAIAQDPEDDPDGPEDPDELDGEDQRQIGEDRDGA